VKAGALDDVALLLPYQLAFFQDRSPVKIASKSRRIGISWSTALESVLVAASSRAAGGSDVFYLSQSIRDSKEFTIACGNFARSLNVAYSQDDDFDMVLADGEGSIRVTQITFGSGFRILILPGTRPDALRGKQGVVVFDEAALLNIPDCLAAAEAFKMWGGRIIFISTQASEDNGFNTELLARADDMGWSVHTFTLHDAVAQGLYRRICLVNGREWTEEAEVAWVADLLKSPRAGQEYQCIPGRAGDVYLPRSLVESRAVECPIIRLALPERWELNPPEERHEVISTWITANLAPLLQKMNPDRIHGWGVDFGRSAKGDLAVIYIHAIEDDMRRSTPFVIECSGVPFDEFESILWTTVDSLPRWIAGKIDKGGNGASVAEHAVQRYGEEMVEGVALSRKWYGDHLPDYRAAFEREEIEVPKNPDVIVDFAVFVLDDTTNAPTTSKRKTKGERGEQRHGDVAIAGLLAYSATKGVMPGNRKQAPARRTPTFKRPW